MKIWQNQSSFIPYCMYKYPLTIFAVDTREHPTSRTHQPCSVSSHL